MAHYTNFARHCLRFYFKFPNKTEFEHDIDEVNWLTCDKVVKDFDYERRQLLKKIYAQNDTLADNIYFVSVTENLDQEILWNLSRKVEKKIARKRGLIK